MNGITKLLGWLIVLAINFALWWGVVRVCFYFLTQGETQ